MKIEKTTFADEALKVRQGFVGGRKTRKHSAATSKVAVDNNASTSEARVNVNLIPRFWLKDVESMVREMRAYFDNKTLPWDNNGWRIVPASDYEEMMNHLDSMDQELTRLKQNVVQNWDRVKEDSEAKLGDLFDESTFPSDAEFQASFQRELEVEPIPDCGHFSAKVLSQAQGKIADRLNERVEAQLAAAHDDLWQRLQKHVNHAAERLAAYTVDGDGKVTNRLYDSVVTNLRDIVPVARSLNIADDQDLESVIRDIERSLIQYPVSDLKQDDSLRSKIANEASRISSNIQKLTVDRVWSASGRAALNKGTLESNETPLVSVVPETIENQSNDQKYLGSWQPDDQSNDQSNDQLVDQETTSKQNWEINPNDDATSILEKLKNQIHG